MARINIKVNTKGKLAGMGERVLEGVRDAVQTSALSAESNAKRLAPVSNKRGGGNLRSGIGHKIDADGLGAEIRSTAAYSAYVEYNTRAHIIRPKKAKVLKFEKGGQTIFAKEVRHPGTTEQPFMRPALREEKPHFIKDIRGAVRRAKR